MKRLCDLGCGRLATHYSKWTKKYRCEQVSQHCPEVKRKNAEKCKKAHAEGRHRYTHNPKSAWAKGLTKETSETVARISKLNSKPRKEETDRLAKNRYREKCRFNLTQDDICKIPGNDLIAVHGYYCKHTNPTGVVRDHRLSVHEAYKLGLDPKLVSHPANCEFLLHKTNAAKTLKSSITVEELIAIVAKW